MSDIAPSHPAAPPNGNGNGSGSGNGSSRGYDRVPPHSLEAEVSVLGAAMLSPDAAGEVLEDLRPDDFYRNAHRAVFEAVQALAVESIEIDAVTVLDWLRTRNRLDEVGGATAIHSLTAAVPTAANASHYARIVKEKSLLRRLIDAGTSVARMGYEPTDDAISVVDRAESLIYEVAETGSTSQYSELKDLLNTSFEHIERLAESRSEVTGLATGFNDLDRLTAGLQRQNLVVIAARPAMGKSSLATGIAHYVAVDLQKPVIMFNLEMSKLEIVNRLLSSEAMIDSRKIKTGRLDDADWRKLGDALGRLSGAPLFIDDTPSITLMEIRAKCRRLKQKRGLEMVVVDYLQLMQSHKRVENRVQEVGEISRGLKMLAKELDVPVIALSQLSRQPENRTDKRPQLADLRESGCLTRGTRLFRADTGAPVTFGELLDRGLRDVPVWATDARGRLVAKDLSHAFPSGVKEVFRVRLRSGAEIEATANHPFRTLQGWTPLGELAEGSRVATVRRIPEPAHPVHVESDELLLLAHLIGEGTTVARQPVHYTSADEANLQAVEKAAWNRFQIEARRAPDGRSAATTQLYLPAPYRLTHGKRNPIAAWLDELGLWDRRSYEKRLPGIVFQLGDDQVRFFLHHLWATDGCIHVRRPGNKGPKLSIYYSTSSPGLAQDLRLLLLRMGLMPRIRRVEQPSGRANYQVWLFGAAQQRRFLTQIGCYGERGERIPEAVAAIDGVGTNLNVDVLPKEVWDDIRARRVQQGMSERAFQAAIGTHYCGSALYKSAPSRERLGRIAEALDDDELRGLATDDLFWDEIVAVEPIGEQEVFDATVPEVHNFVAEGLVLHNSIEQDSDIVAFIYRDEVYDEDSPDRGIAELIVSKHRNGPTGTVKLAFLNHVTKFANLSRGGITSGGGGTPPPAAPPPGTGGPPTPV